MVLDHVQIAIPPGGEDQARIFFGELLGLTEILKPPELGGRGGCWFRIGDRQLHLGIDPDFRPARKAHVAVAVEDLAQLRGKLEKAGHQMDDDVAVDGRERFFTSDPFGNRIEFLQAG